MTDPFVQPYVFPGAERPEPPRPRLGKIVGWVGFVLGLLILIASAVDLSIAGIVLGLCAAAAGGLYLFGKPSRGRLVWATPAVAAIPALIAFGITNPAPETEKPAPVAFAAPAIADVTTSTARPTTTTTTTTTPKTTTAAPTTTTTTVAPAPETVTVYAPAPTTATQYVPAPAPAPVYVADPEPVYVPPAPLAAVPDVPSSVSYANCTAVKAAGAAPIYRGEPGYSSKLDRDGDGIACEK